jgi:hypothetical protein
MALCRWGWPRAWLDDCLILGRKARAPADAAGGGAGPEVPPPDGYTETTPVPVTRQEPPSPRSPPEDTNPQA